MQAKFIINHSNYDFTFSDDDVVNPDEWEYYLGRKTGGYGDSKMFFLHDHGFCVCVVFADHLQDALDIAIDNDKMERYLVSDENLASDYDSDETGITRLGNASEPFDIESLGAIELPIPKLSVAALFLAANESLTPGVVALENVVTLNS